MRSEHCSDVTKMTYDMLFSPEATRNILKRLFIWFFFLITSLWIIKFVRTQQVKQNGMSLYVTKPLYESCKSVNNSSLDTFWVDIGRMSLNSESVTEQNLQKADHPAVINQNLTACSLSFPSKNIFERNLKNVCCPLNNVSFGTFASNTAKYRFFFYWILNPQGPIVARLID